MISKPNNKFSDLHFLIHSNENTTPIVRLSLKYFDKYIGLDNINITVMSNKFLDDSNLPYKEQVNYVSGDVKYCVGGTHYVPTISKALDFIQEKYIFMFTEDYMLTQPIDVVALNNMISLFKGEDVDLLSFSTFAIKAAGLTFKTYEHSAKYGFKEDDLLWTDEKHMHVYSVQPCIWKRSSLQEIIKYNPTMNIHHLDTSHIADKKGRYRTWNPYTICGYSDWENPDDEYKFKKLCTNYYIFDFGWQPQFFILGYIEILRHGKFMVSLGDENWVQKIIYQIINENNLKSDPEYDRYFEPTLK